jgi:hypothetical protein
VGRDATPRGATSATKHPGHLATANGMAGPIPTAFVDVDKTVVAKLPRAMDAAHSHSDCLAVFDYCSNQYAHERQFKQRLIWLWWLLVDKSALN